MYWLNANSASANSTASRGTLAAPVQRAAYNATLEVMP